MKNMSVQAKCTGQRMTVQDRSEQTRRRLIEIAVEVFAERGFQAANTRTIVERAGANLVSIPYYFGNKETLYHAAADYIGLHFTDRFLPTHTRIQAALACSELAHEQILKLYVAYVASFSCALFGSNAPRSWGRFVCREQFAPSSAFLILNKYFEPVLHLSSEFVSRLTGWSVDAPQTVIRSLAVLSLTKCICVDSATLEKVTGWAKLREHEVDAIEQILWSVVRTLFTDIAETKLRSSPSSTSN